MIRTAARLTLALFYFAAGVIHIVSPRPFLLIMPAWVPAPEAVVLWTGIAELLAALASAGIEFKDLKSSESSLEEIFVNLVRNRA